MTDVDLDSAFTSLENSASRFNSVSDTANRALADAEARLVGLNIGIEVWHQTGIEISLPTGRSGADDTRDHIIDVLGFARINGKWCFAVQKVRKTSGFFEGDLSCPYTDEFLESPPVPLLKQSRSVRINALKQLPAFLKQVNEEVNATTLNLTDTIEALAS